MSAEVASSSIDAAAQLLLACPLRLEGADAAAVVPARYRSAVSARMCDAACDDVDDDDGDAGARRPSAAEGASSAQPAPQKPTLSEHREKLERLLLLRERLRRSQEREGLQALLALATSPTPPADSGADAAAGGCDDAARLRALTLAHALGGDTPQLRAAAEKAGQLALAEEARRSVVASAAPSPKELRRATLKAACRAGSIDAAGGGGGRGRRPGFDPYAHLPLQEGGGGSGGGGDAPVPAAVVAAFHAARGRVLLGALRAAWGDAEEAAAVAETQQVAYPAQGLLGDVASLLASPEVFPACTVAAEAVQLVKILHLAAASAAAVASGCSGGGGGSPSSEERCRALLPVLLTQLARPLQLYSALRGGGVTASGGGGSGGRSTGSEKGLLVRHNSLLFLAANARILHDALLHNCGGGGGGTPAFASHDLTRLRDASRVLERAAAAALDSFARAHTARVHAVLGGLYAHAGLEAPADAPAAAAAPAVASAEAASPLTGGLLSGSSAQLVGGMLGGLSGATRHLGRDLRRGLQSTLFESEAGRRASEEAVERTLGQVVSVLRTLESDLSEGASDDGDGGVRRAILGRACSVAVETIVDFVLRLAGTGEISATLGEGLARACGYFQGVLRTWFVSEGERQAAEKGAASSAEAQRRLDGVVAATLERRVPALALFDDVLRVLEAPRMADVMRLRADGGGLPALPTEHLVALLKALYEDSETRRTNVALLEEETEEVEEGGGGAAAAAAAATTAAAAAAA
eukprot:Rhum_TRINITY_DN14960_c31_g1::Rhum_TRINITY_DN14960_c31_g1_i1::g.130517::m.130517